MLSLFQATQQGYAMNSQTCRICEIGQLTPYTERVTVKYLDQQGQIDSKYSVCDCCGSEQVSAAEAHFNKSAMITFKKQVQGLLTGNDEYVSGLRCDCFIIDDDIL